jgi:putative phosphoesterase
LSAFSLEEPEESTIAGGAGPPASEPPTGGALDGPHRRQHAEPKKKVSRPRVTIGVIADAHGYLDPLVISAFAGVDHIVVAGDTLDPDILARLSEVAPVTAVRGASDGDELAGLPQEATGEVGGVRFAVGHSSKRLLKQLSSGGISAGPSDSVPDLVVWAGTHKPAADWIDASLFLNPGTASSPDREDNGPTVAIVGESAAGLAVRFVPLRRAAPGKPPVHRMLGFRGGLVPTMMERDVRTPRGKKGAR